jgi:hypothetical protein
VRKGSRSGLNKRLFSGSFDKVKKAWRRAPTPDFFIRIPAITPLYYAVACRQKSIVALLLKYHADPNIATENPDKESNI